MVNFIGKEAQLISMPDGCIAREQALTVGNWYTIVDVSGSNVITNSDEPGKNAHYWSGRLDLLNCRLPAGQP